ncbi:catenin alpha-like [Panonychus citri]|uniref:catenin alpha-like n=1 Tax=Panonychus citri TaxID=50023 RepID=UPI0023077EAD|nr:catenin alpha-like [Panonychus citri]
MPLKIETRTIEETLAPLVLEVTTLVNNQEKRKGGRSKRPQVLVATVEKSIENFITIGEEIARENEDIQKEMSICIDKVREAGKNMSEASREFADDPFSSVKRSKMVQNSRNLLYRVAELIILADGVDVTNLLRSLEAVESDLNNVANSNSHDELIEHFNKFGVNANNLFYHAAKRQNELKDSKARDDLGAARAVLKKNSMMLLTASKVFVRHPELSSAKENRDFIFRQVCEAVNTVRDVAKGNKPKNMTDSYDIPGEMATALDDFDERFIMEPLTYNESTTRPDLERQLESIISGAALMADSSCTRDIRRERIVAECNAVRQALQDLLSEYLANVGSHEPSDNLERAVEHMTQKTKDLRRQLRKSVIDHVSDSFMETNVPLLVLDEAARRGDEVEVERYQAMFEEHANKLVEVANLACSMSNNEEGVRMVRYAALQIKNLCPQVINAAKILAARPKSKVAIENMDAFKNLWETQVRILTEAVDDITTIDDFLAVSESHILEDVKECVSALGEHDGDNLDRMAGAIRGRAARVCNVVTAEMDNYEPNEYTERVLAAVNELRNTIMPSFAGKVEKAVELLSNNQLKDLDDNQFIDASRMVYDGVREIRRAVLIDRSPEDIDSETDMDYEDNIYETRSKSSVITDFDEFPDVAEISNTREAYRMISEEEKQKIAAQFETFRTEKVRFDREVAKWDEKGNDIIVIAKKMCYIMIEMTEFTRGKGPLKTTMDVIGKAKEISELGTTLDKFAGLIAGQCPESDTKKDLLAYLKRIELYCQQLNITSKVKADVQNISGNLIVSGLDSATSLIQAAKNLMNAVVLTVKASYVASTKYPRGGIISSPIVVWKMRAPEKKPLVRREKPEEVKAVVRKGSTKRNDSPLKALSQFQTDGL